MISVLTRYWH